MTNNYEAVTTVPVTLERETQLENLDTPTAERMKEIELSDEFKNLSVPQRRFALAYIQCWSMSDACKIAGIARSTGYKHLSNERVTKFVEKFFKAYAGEEIASARETLALVTAVARGEEGQENYIVNGKTGKIHALPPTATERLKAMELLMKNYGMLKDVGYNVHTLSQDTAAELPVVDMSELAAFKGQVLEND